MATSPTRLNNFYWFNSEGAITAENLSVVAFGFFSQNTTAVLEITMGGTSLVMFAKENVNVPSFQLAEIPGVYSGLSAKTVTACSGWVYLRGW
jgi:hypothetical protein